MEAIRSEFTMERVQSFIMFLVRFFAVLGVICLFKEDIPIYHKLVFSSLIAVVVPSDTLTGGVVGILLWPTFQGVWIDFWKLVHPEFWIYQQRFGG